MSKRSKASSLSIEQDVIKALSEFEPLSHVDYAEAAGIHRVTAFDRMKKVKARKLIYIKDWRRGVNGPPAPLYAIGNLPDAPPPPAYTSREKCRRWEEKLRTQDGGAGWRRLMQHKKVYHKRKMREDRMYADRMRATSTAWARKNRGHKARLPNLRKIDPLLAAIMAPLNPGAQQDER